MNHKNFVYLIGYCKEDEPFTRMMVFECAPNGTLFDYLLVRIILPLFPTISSIMKMVDFTLQVPVCCIFHFSVKEAEHLDWNMRVRIIMGIAYCLQYIHNEINPPMAHSNLNSSAIFLTDGYAAKVCRLNSHME